jgi:hypothetical protein
MPFDGTDFGSDAAILRAARDGIADPERWCQGALLEHRPGGTARCVEGWILQFAAGNVVPLVSRYLFPELPWHLRHGMAQFDQDSRAFAVVRFQDTAWRRHAAVVALFDRAIARLEA